MEKEIFSCHVCKSPLDMVKENLFSEQLEKSPSSNLIKSYQNRGMCLSCSVDLIQCEKKLGSYKTLMNCLYGRTKVMDWHWQKREKMINVGKFIRKKGFEHLADVYTSISKDAPIRFPSRLDVRYLDARNTSLGGRSITRKQRAELSKKLNGAEFKSEEDYRKFLTKAVSIDTFENNTFGIILLPDDNYITMIDGQMLPVLVVAKCLDDTKSISLLKTSKRSGSATGFVTSNSISSSVPYQKETMLFPSNSGVSANVAWKANDGEVKMFKGVYADAFVESNSPRKKRKLLQDTLYQRNLLIRQGLSRLLSAVVVQKFNLDTNNTCLDMLRSIDQNILDEINKLQRKTDEYDEDIFSKSLLNYMCTFGKCNNYESLCVHIDGNHRSKMETLTIFGRIDKAHIHTTIKNRKKKVFLSLYHVLKNLEKI